MCFRSVCNYCPNLDQVPNVILDQIPQKELDQSTVDHIGDASCFAACVHSMAISEFF